MGRETGQKPKSREERNIGQIFICWYSKSKLGIYYLQLYWCAHLSDQDTGVRNVQVQSTDLAQTTWSVWFKAEMVTASQQKQHGHLELEVLPFLWW